MLTVEDQPETVQVAPQPARRGSRAGLVVAIVAIIVALATSAVAVVALNKAQDTSERLDAAKKSVDAYEMEVYEGFEELTNRINLIREQIPSTSGLADADTVETNLNTLSAAIDSVDWRIDGFADCENDNWIELANHDTRPGGTYTIDCGER